MMDLESDFPLHDEFVIAALAALDFAVIADFRLSMQEIGREHSEAVPRLAAVFCALAEVGYSNSSFSLLKALRKLADWEIEYLERQFDKRVFRAEQNRIIRLWRTIRDLVRGVIAERPDGVS